MRAVIFNDVVATQPDLEIIVHRLVIKEVLLNHGSAIPETNNKIVKPEVRIQLHDVPEDGTAANLYERLGTILRLFPQPSALSTAKNNYFQMALSNAALWRQGI